MKAILIILQILVLTIAAYEGAGIVYKTILPPGENESEKPGASSVILHDNEDQTSKTAHLESYEIIRTRNLFDVLTRKPEPDRPETAEDAQQTPVEKSDLKLALWGTVIAEPPSGSYAVIENQATREQALYQTGDSLVGAVLKQILRNKVILTKEGQDQFLEIDESKRPAIPMTASLPLPELESEPRPVSFSPSDDMAAESDPADLSDLMRQVRIRPYFSDGKPSGLLLYGIRNDSIFQAAGFKNGDIIQAINGNQILSAMDAQAVYQALQDGAGTQTIQVTILRRGEPMEIML